MKLSIIIPIYNCEDYLQKCLESIISQKIDGYEVIMINDGSKDKSKNIAEEYTKKYNNFTLINQENKGAAEARNVGIENSNGEYIFFLDSDDFLKDDNSLKKCYECIYENNLDLVIFDAEIIRETNNYLCENNHYYERNKYIKDNEIFSGLEFFEKYYTMGMYRVAPYLYIIKKEFLKKNSIEFINGLIGDEDDEFSFKLFFLAKKIEYMPIRVVARRIRENSLMTEKITNKRSLTAIYVLLKIFKIIKEANNKLSKENIFVFKQLVLDYFVVTINKIVNMEDKEYCSLYSRSITKKFACNYYKIFDDKFSLSYMFALLKIIKILEDNNLEYGYILKIICNKYNLRRLEKGDIQLKCIDLIKCKFNKIRLNESNSIIGIYGVGTHSKIMLEFYEKYIDKIKSRIIFIDSNKGMLNEKFLNYNVINVNDIEQYEIQDIVISSMFENEIIELLKRNGYNKKIYTFYENETMILFTNKIFNLL